MLVVCAGPLIAADTTGGVPLREFVLADSPQSVSLDPLHTFTSFESQFYTAIYEGLVVANPRTLEPVPGVAESWTTSNGEKTWTFQLRSDALYSNGDHVRAQDFVAAWMRMLTPSNNAEYSFLFDVIKGAHAYRTGAVTDASTVGLKAVSDTVLQVTLESPVGYFLKLLTHISFLPLHPTLTRSTGWENNATVIGNGPFTIKSKTNQEILLEKNPRYWDAANVAMDRVRIRFMDDAGDATDGYITGKINWVSSSLISNDRLTAYDSVEIYPMFGTTYFFFESDKAPWSDYRVRRGLSLLVPWDQIRTKKYFAFPSDVLIPSISGYPSVKGIAAQQVDEGLKLLADAGFPKGKGLPTLVVKLAQGSTDMKDLVATMSTAWKSLIGLDVSVVEVDPDAYLAETRKGDFTLAVSTWIGDYADPLTFLQLWTTGSNLNDAHFSDKDYDAAVADAASLQDQTKRYRRLADAEQILLDKASILPLDHSPAVNLINTAAVGGWYSNPLDVHPFKFLTFKARTAPPGIAMAIE